MSAQVDGEPVYSSNNARVRGKLIVGGTWPNMTYSYTLAREYANISKLAVIEGKLRLEIISQPYKNDLDLVGLTLDIQNDTIYPLLIHVINDDVVNPRFVVGEVTGAKGIIMGVWHPGDGYTPGYWEP